MAVMLKTKYAKNNVYTVFEPDEAKQCTFMWFPI